MPPLLRSLTFCLLGLGALAAAGCSRQPIASGQIVMVTLGEKPVPRSGEIGTWGYQTFNDGKIEIYDTYILVTDASGTKYCAPPDRFGIVRFK